MANRIQTIAEHVKQSSATVGKDVAGGGHDPHLLLGKKEKKPFRYTLNANGALTDEQRVFYEQNGYIVIPKLVSDDEIDGYRKQFLALCENPELRPSNMVVLRDIELVRQGKKADSEANVTKVQEFQEDPVLFSFCQHSRILHYVEAFTGPDIVASHTMVINKPPDLGKGTSRHPLHQDLLYFPFRPADRIVAAWTAMEHVSRQNGCLVAVPGSHKTELLEHGYPDWEGGANAAYLGIMGITPEVKYIHLVMEKGDTVFFHPLLWHGSGRNLTSSFRKAISCHFVSADCHFIDVKGTIQEDLEEEYRELIKVFGKKRGMVFTDEMLKDFEAKDLWESKSRVVKGTRMIGE